MQLDDASHYCQPKSEPAVLSCWGRVRLAESIKNVGYEIGANADARVDNQDFDISFRFVQSQSDTSSGRRELDRVR